MTHTSYDEHIGATVRIDNVGDIERWAVEIEGRRYSYDIRIETSLAALGLDWHAWHRGRRDDARIALRKRLDREAPIAGPHPACFICGSPARFHLDGWGDCDDEPAEEWRAFREWPMFRERDRWACVHHRLNARYAIHATDPIGPALVRSISEHEHRSVPHF